MSELPVGWASCQLGDLLDHIQAGKNVKCDERPPEGEEPGLVKISAVTWGKFDELESKTLLSDDGLEARNKIQPGDLLISRANTLEFVGAPVIVHAITKNLYLSDKVLRLDIAEPLRAWALTCLKSKSGRSQIEALATGNQLSMRNISQDALRSIELPLPPLAEQKRIAQKLDALLAQVDTLKARIDAIPALLKRFRSATLKAAIAGELTKSWRDNRHQSSHLTWEKTTFSEICREITVGYVGKMANQYRPTGVPFLRSQNVRPLRFSPENLLYISEDFHSSIGKSRLEPGDLAIVRSGAPGVTCVIPSTLEVANCSDLVIARPGPRLNSGFGCIFMNSEIAQQNVADNQVGVAQQHFNVGSMKKMSIHLPPIEEQLQIVQRVELLLAFADQLEAKVAAAKQRIDALTQSLLAKAFRGELVPQDPGDEPASVLLDRIRAQRAAAPKPKRGRKAATS
ncbi:hypothetical protein EYC55_17325 [Xanthomonas oryzae]|uniref:restriction endonuclease subunit S n=1 Tax=Xanthomonas oryzae TaxID=347 RepID=UPI00103392A9|nr:restriction endonuclease subunit S [Xanthomonas oryzae]QBG96813.1 hypothetical protein EYC55_17325 [Xanthomonas oryzae]